MCSIWLVLPCFTMKQFYGMTTGQVDVVKDIVMSCLEVNGEGLIAICWLLG